MLAYQRVKPFDYVLLFSQAHILRNGESQPKIPQVSQEIRIHFQFDFRAFGCWSTFLILAKTFQQHPLDYTPMHVGVFQGIQMKSIVFISEDE